MERRDLATIANDLLCMGLRLGDYQQGLLRALARGGQPRWSNSLLRGKASKYSGKYTRSRDKVYGLIIAEARRAGWQGIEVTPSGPHRRLELRLVDYP
jgi:hypothetical protein